MARETDSGFDFEQILANDDVFVEVASKKNAVHEPRYYRNNLSSNGGLLSREERKIAKEIFDPNDPVFLDVARSAFE